MATIQLPAQEDLPRFFVRCTTPLIPEQVNNHALSKQEATIFCKYPLYCGSLGEPLDGIMPVIKILAIRMDRFRGEPDDFIAASINYCLSTADLVPCN